jgi:phosphoenolpyruvate synthase/pyruvate phosphate dikinase
VPKFVYYFTEGNKDLKDLLGGKGANLAEMTNLGLPVPPGFTMATLEHHYRDLCDIEFTIEHGGDPDSVHFFHEVGLDNVSCSPFRVPAARLEAGRAAVASDGSDTR